MDERIPASLEDRGEPDLAIGGLRVWIGGYQFPNSQDVWDGNWLWTSAYCASPQSSVSTEGAFLTTADIATLSSECAKLARGDAKAARMKPMEPYLDLQIKSRDQLGHFDVRINITPDNIRESHSFEFEIDQTYLDPIVGQCEAILKKYPIRGRKNS